MNAFHHESERVADMTDEFKVETPAGSVSGSGQSIYLVVTVLLFLAIGYAILWQTDMQGVEHRDIVHELGKNREEMVKTREEIARTGRDVFLSSIVSQDEKKELPHGLKERAVESLTRRAEEVIVRQQKEQP